MVEARARETVMSNSEPTDHEEIQSMARRQLIGSLVVAFVIAIASGLTALRPASHVTADVVTPHRVAAIQHPSFVTPRVAIAQSSVEVP